MPGFAGLMDVDSGDVCLYGNDVDMDDIIWMGPQPSVKDLAASVGGLVPLLSVNWPGL